VRIPHGADTGYQSMIEGEGAGIDHLDAYGNIDEYIMARVVTPVNLSNTGKDLLRQFGRLRQKSGGDRDE